MNSEPERTTRKQRIDPRLKAAGYFTGSGIAHLTGVSLARVPVPLPPIEEQREIVRRVDHLLVLADALKQRIEAGSKRVERSSQAVLAKAFRGELTMSTGLDARADL